MELCVCPPMHHLGEEAYFQHPTIWHTLSETYANFAVPYCPQNATNSHNKRTSEQKETLEGNKQSNSWEGGIRKETKQCL